MKMMTIQYDANRLGQMNNRNQRGAVLIVSVIILLILTIVSLSSSQNIVLQEKMTGSSRQASLALIAAESALRDAENYLDGIVTLADFNSNGTNGYYSETATAPTSAEMFLSTTWDPTKTQPVTVNITPDFNGSGAAAPTASYFLVDLGEMDKVSEDPSQSADLNIGGAETGVALASTGITKKFYAVARGVSADGKSEKIVRVHYVKNM
jgi:type IV pilus assembly protein PilX